MRNKRKKIIQICATAALVILMAFFAAPVRDVFADAGEFSGNSDYDFSGGADYDSGGDSFGGDWDSWDDDSNRDYGGGIIVDSGGSSSARRSSSGNAADTGELILIFWLILIVALIIYTKRKRNNGTRVVRNRDLGGTDIRQDRSVLRPMQEYTALDPSFDEEKFKTLLSNVYVQMQQQWTKKDFESLRPYFTDSLYAQFDRQLDAYRKGSRTNYIDRIAVLSVNLAGFYQTGSKTGGEGAAAAGEDVIVAEIRSRIVDYTLDDATGELLSGSKTAEKFMTYEWTLTRTSGLTSRKEGEFTTVNCPNCGAPVNINESAKCPYCGSVLHLREHDFVISGIKGIAQRTSG